ncbi:hypothetical protein [Staphylococcus haemolyticus]|uniref:hypothetical protein n=1 Tax=Staphylococcus haemolyticus TaxID=1283 RepID=UPI00115A8D29|nr:hypothetical protein [Staphylococcus haemolyticus]
MQTKLYNEKREHLATVKQTENGLYDVEGVEGTQLSHIKRRGSIHNLNTFKRDFELYYASEFTNQQTSIFDYLGG